MRDTESDMRGSTLPIVGALVAFYGLIQIFFVFLVLTELGVFHLLFQLFWVPLVVAVPYVVLGFGLQDRHLWAYSGMVILFILMLIALIGSIILIDDPIYDALAAMNMTVHISILTYLAWHRGRFKWELTESVRTVPKWEEDGRA